MQHDQDKHLHKHYIYWQAEPCIIADPTIIVLQCVWDLAYNIYCIVNFLCVHITYIYLNAAYSPHGPTQKQVC